MAPCSMDRGQNATTVAFEAVTGFSSRVDGRPGPKSQAVASIIMSVCSGCELVVRSAVSSIVTVCAPQNR